MPLPDASPLNRLRRAQTTNERMSAAFSAMNEWSDDDRTTADRSSMLSAQSVDIPSSDEEHYVVHPEGLCLCTSV